MTADARPAAPSPAFAAGTVLADRYAITAHLRTTALTEVYRATDRHTDDGAGGQPVLLHVLTPGLGQPEHLGANTAAIGAAADLEHPAIAGPLDVDLAHQPGFVVTRDLTGHSLRELLARRAATGAAGFATRGAIRIALAICEAVSAANARGMYHGALSVDSVYVDDSGEVTVVDFGLGAVLARAAMSAPGAAPVVHFLAPEARASGEIDPGSDVYSMGHLLYEILVGRPLQRGGPRPSEAQPGLPPAIDELIARSALPQAAQRPGSVAEIRSALESAMQSAAQASAERAASGEFPSLAQSLPPGQLALDPGIIADTDEKWLISKGKLDYGPFNMAEVVAQIQSGEVVAGNVIVDNHSGERGFVEEHPLLANLVEQSRQLRDDNRRAQAEASHAKKEKQRGTLLYAVIAGGVVLLGLVVYLVVSMAGEDEKVAAGQGIDVVGDGEFKAAIRFHKSSDQKTRKKPRSRRKGSSGGAGSGDTLALDMSDDGGSERLDDGVINGVIQKHGRALGGCLAKNGGGRADIKFIILGPSGKVSWVKVNDQQSGGLYNCINRVMRKMKFPSIDGPRTRAEFDMEL